MKKTDQEEQGEPFDFLTYRRQVIEGLIQGKGV
jgi:hypothetical protein